MALVIAGDTVARCELLLALGDARARAGETSASKDAFREAAELAERHGLREQLARAALGYGGRIIWEVSRDDEHLVPLLERALTALGDDESELRVRLLARLAGGPLRDVSFAPERKAAVSHEALASARRLDDPATLAYALQGYILGHHSPGPHPTAAGAGDRADRRRGARRRQGARRRGTREPSRRAWSSSATRARRSASSRRWPGWRASSASRRTTGW